MYTQDEIDMILNRFKNNDTFTCAFLVACFTGMRTGEVCALTWDNIDFEKRTINIEHNVYSKVKDEKGNNIDLIAKLFDEIAPKYEGRVGGYTRIIKAGPRRGDAAEVAILQLV